jgi:energy-converting hydrogenase Eha subunit H
MDAVSVANIVGLAAMIAGLIRLIAGSVASNVGFGVRQLQIMSVENHARLQVCRFSIAGCYTYRLTPVFCSIDPQTPIKGFRAIRTRYFCKAQNYLAMIHLACALIVSRKLETV